MSYLFEERSALNLFYYSRPDFSVVRLKPLPKPNSFYEEGESWTLFHYSQLLC